MVFCISASRLAKTFGNLVNSFLKMGNCSTTTTHSSSLTAEEISAVKDAWIKAKNENIGKKILATLLEKRPQFATFYGIPADAVTKKAMDSNNQFQLQAYRIQNFLDTAVSSLGFCPMNSVYDMARRIGQIHFYKGVNFGADNYLVFKRVTIDEILNAALAEEKANLQKEENGNEVADFHSEFMGDNCPCRLGWNKLMNEVVREMKKGFLEEAMQNCKDEVNVNKLVVAEVVEAKL